MSDDIPILTLADGTKIDMRTGGRVEDTYMTEEEVEEEVAKLEERAPDLAIGIRRRLHELPDTPQTMNIVLAVLGYELYGLPIEDISYGLNTTDDIVRGIIESDAYINARREIMSNLFASIEEEVRGSLVKGSLSAANTIRKLLSSRSEEMKLKAANSILDRTGHSAAMTINHKHSMDDELVIRIVQSTDDKKLPVLDLKAITNA